MVAVNETRPAGIDEDGHAEMGWATGLWVLAIQILIVLAVVSWVYGQIGSFRKRPWWVTWLSMLGWCNALLVVFMIPNDLLSVCVLAIGRLVQKAHYLSHTILIINQFFAPKKKKDGLQ
jgi:hypothetical protein